MRVAPSTVALVFVVALSMSAQSGPAVPPQKPVPDVTALVSRLDLDSYKATIKSLTQFGDRRQGTERNRTAVDWIEAQLQSYGCPTERIKYVYDPPPPRTGGGAPAGGGGGGGATDGSGGFLRKIERGR